MRNWFKTLLACLVGRERICTGLRTDWRGRPPIKKTRPAIHPVGLPEEDPHATLRLPSLADASGAAPGMRVRWMRKGQAVERTNDVQVQADRR
jgi:hypothetical protein